MKKYGLFVGINQYTNDITPLKCALNDAMALARIFSLTGYKVDILLDAEASATNIRKKLREIGKKLQKDDVFLFYFSGHGCEVNHNHCLIGQAAYPDGIEAGEEIVAMDRVRELTDVPGVWRLFMLDCCRNNIHGGKGLELCPESRDLALSKISGFQYEHPEVIQPLIVTSCSTGERSYEDEKRGRGYFTQILEHSLEDKAVDSFSSFRKVLADGMKKLQNGLNRKQTLCWHGNVDAWDDFKLLDSWKSTVIPKEPESVPQQSSEPEMLTCEDERMEFYDLVYELDNKFASLLEFPVTQKIYSALNELQKSTKELGDCNPTKDSLRKLKQNKFAAEQFEKVISCYHICRDITAKLVSVKEFLMLHNVLQVQKSIDLESRAQFAEEKEDFEVASKLWGEAKTILDQQQSQLAGQLSRIKNLNAEIKKTEAQLSGSDDFKSSYADCMKQVEEYEAKGDYSKVQSLLEDFLAQSKTLLHTHTERMRHIGELQKAVQKLEDKLNGCDIVFSENMSDIKATAVQSFDQKKYSESEAQWNLLLDSLQKINREYDSFLKIKARVKEWVQNFPEEEAIPDEVKKLREQAMTAEKMKDFRAAKLYWEKFIHSSVKYRQDAIDAMNSNYEKQNRQWWGYFIDSDLYYEYHLARTSEYDELNFAEKIKYDETLAQRRLKALSLEKKFASLYWILFIPVSVICLFICMYVFNDKFAGVAATGFLSLLFLSALYGFRFGRSFLAGLLYDIALVIILGDTWQSVLVLFVSGPVFSLAPFVLSLFLYGPYKLLWGKKYGDLITSTTFIH